MTTLKTGGMTMSVLHLRFVLVTLVIGALILLGRDESVAEDSPDTPMGERVSFTRDIKPIFDMKCVACHACFDAPGQLDLRSVKGIVRGAMKFDPYGGRGVPVEPTFVWNSPNTLESWRKLGFYSVIEGGRNSIMGKLLALGHANPVKPNEKFPADFEIDQMLRKKYLPNRYEIDGYVAQFPRQGMPFAVSGLSDSEYEAIMSWLESGAPIDYVGPKPTARELAHIRKWEDFLNADDKRSRLIARYIFEHMFLVNFRFEDRDDANSFIFVRSTTPSGEEAVPVYQHLPNGEVDGDFYYRFMHLDESDCSKMTRLQLFASEEKLDRWKNIFFEEDWSVDQLPGYTDAERFDPLRIFSAIPARARWRFLLDNGWYIRGQIVHGPSCYGNLSIGVMRDMQWHVYENPETSLYVNDAQYRAELDPLLALMINPKNLLDAIVSRHKFVERRKEATVRALARAKEVGYRSSFSDIWRGEHSGDKPLISVYRHDDNGYVVEGNWVPGDWPKSILVIDLPIMENSAYPAYINYDVFGTSISQLTSARALFGLARVDAELNFLRFLPREGRRSMWENSYRGPLSDERMKLEEPSIAPEDTIPTDIEYSTDDPKREFYEGLLKYLGPRVDTIDPINRPKPGDDADRITEALISIVAASREQEPTWRKFKTFLPEAVFLRIDRAGQEPGIYTMTRDRDYATKAFITMAMQQEIPRNAKVSILEGAYTSYPNFMFRINEDEIQEFASTLIDADTREKFSAVVDRWGIRRSSPDFWPVLNSVNAYMERRNPRKAGTFDINRYKDP